QPLLSALFPYTTLFRSKPAFSGLFSASLKEEGPRTGRRWEERAYFSEVQQRSRDRTLLCGNHPPRVSASLLNARLVRVLESPRIDRKSTRLNSSHVKIS